MNFFIRGSSSQGVYPKKDNLLIFITPAQSNSGSIDDGTAQPTGRVPYANMPTRLQTPLANVDFVKQTGSSLSVADMEVSASNEWGWINQFLYVISGSWDDIIYCKKSLGGSTLLSGGLGDYPRADFELRAPIAIAEADSRWGVGNYNIVYIAGIGETNSLSAANANDWLPAMQEWIDSDLRVNYKNGPIVVIKKGLYQVIDFPYIVSNLWAAQDAYVALNTASNFMAEGYGAKWQLLDQSDDYSHYNAAGSISMGNSVADKVLEIFSATKSDDTTPTLVSAVVENAAPSNLVLTYSKNLDASNVPFWKDFTFSSPSSNKIVSSIAISGATVTLTCSEAFYTGQTITLSYTKGNYYSNVIADPYGNEAAAFANLNVTNNVLTAVPTYTTRYTSNFSAGVDSWGGLSGGGVAAVDGIGGQDDVLEFSAASDNSPIISRSSIFTGTAGHQYVIDMDVYVPIGILVSASASNDYSLVLSEATGASIQSTMYPYIRRNVLGGQWFHFQRVFTAASVGNAMRYEGNWDIGEKVYFKNILVRKIN